jgi:hypothetical protein
MDAVTILRQETAIHFPALAAQDLQENPFD